MKIRSARYARTAVVSVAVALAVSLAGACAGADPAPGSGGKNTTGAESAESPEPAQSADQKPPASSGKTLTEGELKKVALVDGDVPGFAVTPMQGGGETGTERADRPQCRPLAAVINGAPEPAPAAAVFRTLVDETQEGQESQTVVTEILTSYSTGGAARMLRGVKDAIGECADGFKTTGGEGPSTYTEVKELPAPKAGQEALAYQITGSFQGAEVPLVFQLVRSGSTVVILYTANFIDAKTPEIPARLAKAQAAKLP